MRIALLGGTGDIGEGLALRWARDTEHEVVVGSREAERARSKADDYERTLEARGRDRTVEAAANQDAAVGAEVVVCSVPAYHLSDTIDSVADHLAEDAVLVTPAVGMQRGDEGFHYNPPDAGSVTGLAVAEAPADVPVVGAFHNLAAGKLANLDADLHWDTIVVADDDDAKATVSGLAEEIEGLRALDGGPLANAPEVESLTPLLINLAQHNEGLHDLGVRFN
jgi:NADPH-dependent F420 reductase